MKKILSVLILAILLFQTVPAFAVFAETDPDFGENAPQYARVEQDDVYFFSQPQESSGVFILPKTYFVKIIGNAGEYYEIEYGSAQQSAAPLTGYCRKSDVAPVDYIPETPYLAYRTSITFSAGDETALPDDFITSYTVSADFYGTFFFGSSVYYYVNMEGTFGYVPATVCPPLDYPLNTEHTQTEPSDTANPSEAKTSAANIVLICALSVAALGAIYFLFRPSKAAADRDPFAEDSDQFDESVF